jgi:hypothetical protein
LGVASFASATPSAKACKTVTVTTRSHGHTARRRERLCETAAIGLTRPTVTAVGGTVTVHYASTQATECTLAATPLIWHGRNPAPVRCRGEYTFHVVPANAGRSWTFRFVARNRYGEVIGVQRILVATPAPTILGVVPGYSSNWSGYAFEGAGFASATGTFTVPSLSPTQYESDTSEWVGIDGVSNDSLIQAGVHEEYADGQLTVWPWWEVLPAPETAIPSMNVNVDDSITVNVHEVFDTSWQITLTDNTTGQSYTTRQTYTGPSTSAEWIVEAPTIGSQTATLGDFAPITFSGLNVNGVEMSLDQLFMVGGGGNQISTPSALDPNGFAVAYGPTPPAAP